MRTFDWWRLNCAFKAAVIGFGLVWLFLWLERFGIGTQASWLGFVTGSLTWWINGD